MASAWVKSWQCKSRAFEDVYHPHPKILSASCRKTMESIKEMVEIPKPRPRPRPKPKTPLEKHPSSKYPSSATKPEFEARTTMTRSRSSTTTTTSSRGIIELPEGHPSRNVVEIIFHTSWGPKPFPGRVELIFKLQNAPRTVSRFEEFREAMKGRAAAGLAEGNDGEENARCIADGNEVMRFHCLGPAGDGGPYDAGCAWSFPEKKGAAICTFSGSGGAHETAGGGRGRRAMLVCRVVAGRVSKQLGFLDSLLDKRVGFDSVSRDNGELLVFDSRAVLPCFLIIYRL
ncbi:hypothetical protein GLYMA_05G056600v4 [Glycine max]|uniref:PARP catalytic domain-containing protein n=1 Tax=Glycine max TaxID=3847 RepID=I1K0L9_SOYBN|nr:uncharacterized protein LOC100811674 [Glycine max]KAH1132982.1 hypothetical protein GYH30_011694 [Glycine max]KRH57359.1 hypothetical protein GLYMA_05G056600v4 [Glycine max]|eukprot:XP_003525562.1 uncharacterized protein LOC100811674 [Glycine max]